MATRDPRKDPEAGDVLVLKPNKVEVTRREGDTVHFIAFGTNGNPNRPLHQSITGWRKWAAEFKVKQRGIAPGECVVMGGCISGPCSCGCRQYVFQNVHMLDDRIYAPSCCVAVRHGVQKGRKRIQA